MTIPQAFEIAAQHHHAGRLAEAEAIYRQILAADPAHADSLYRLGLIAHRVGRNDVAVECIRQAIAIAPQIAELHSNLGEAYRALGRTDEAIASYRHAIALRPDLPEAHYNLGNALAGNKRWNEAIATYRQAIALRHEFPDAHYNLALLLSMNGLRDEAISSYRTAISLRPGFPEAYSNLGALLNAKGEMEEAISACRQAIMGKPDFSGAYMNLGNALKDNGQTPEAIAAHLQAIALNPGNPHAHSNLGAASIEQGQLGDAIAAFRQAIHLKPDNAEACNNLGSALYRQGRADEAIDSYREAVRLKPDFSEAHSNLIHAMHVRPGLDVQAIAEEHRCWNQQHAEPLRRFIQPHLNDRNPRRRLRIGYVSADFRTHAVARFVEGLFACRDPLRFDVFCYANVMRPDEMTARLRGMVTYWREIAGVPDEQVADVIRRDGIDILVDLAGHTARNLLLVFARKPAPVQVTWLGYPDTTGMRAMDYRITDAIADPPDTTEHLHSEQLVRVPDSAWCFSASAEAPLVSPSPVLSAGYLTFGCFNAHSKINLQLLELWSKILKAVPGSRILLKNSSLLDPQTRGRTRMILRGCGIDRRRIKLAGFTETLAEHLAFYNRVDIALDTLPYNGTTTTCEALWMGVPVVSLAGKSHVSRVGLSLLSNVGLKEFAASTSQEYIRLAVNLADNLPRLISLRGTLRERMQSSPLMDARRFAGSMEQAYRRMWRTWCANQTSESLP